MSTGGWSAWKPPTASATSSAVCKHWWSCLLAGRIWGPSPEVGWGQFWSGRDSSVKLPQMHTKLKRSKGFWRHNQSLRYVSRGFAQCSFLCWCGNSQSKESCESHVLHADCNLVRWQWACGSMLQQRPARFWWQAHLNHSQVFLARHTKTGQLVAIKRIWRKAPKTKKEEKEEEIGKHCPSIPSTYPLKSPCISHLVLVDSICAMKTWYCIWLLLSRIWPWGDKSTAFQDGIHKPLSLIMVLQDKKGCPQ